MLELPAFGEWGGQFSLMLIVAGGSNFSQFRLGSLTFFGWNTINTFWIIPSFTCQIEEETSHESLVQLATNKI